VPQDVKTVEVDVPLPPPDFDQVVDDTPVLRPASVRLDPLAGLTRDQMVRRAVEDVASEAAEPPPAQPPASVTPAPTQSAGTSRKARPLDDNPPPTYPERARKRGWTGVVLLHIHVSEDGEVLEVEVAESSGYSDLDRSARRAALDWRYRPALRDGDAVATWLAQPVRFRL
jgi:protein TonB